ncbi:OmpA family protein [Pedobacter sp. BS3]|uniref:OmpA family protein n=1 Tax=Pedobacter sp. BS3 TaxID=2567937 RepID=UPI0011EE4059|nr:OmpA family protein [Pedobacter sp. BS3]TZF81066.1 OmpA family protein [Pedobacter sp. BS3]
MRYKSLLVITIVFAAYFFPQNIFSDDIEKANKYYEKYDFKFALDIYEKLMTKQPSLEIAQKIASCYNYMNDSQHAEAAYARVLTFKGFDPVNYKYYADMLKQNGKYTEAKNNYLLYGEHVPQQAKEAQVMANACDMARTWAENPDRNVRIENELSVNSEYSDFSPVVLNNALYFISDRLFSIGKYNRKDVIYGWTGNPYLKIYQAGLTGMENTVVPLPKPVNEKYHNGPCAFTASGDTLYYTRTDLPANRKRESLVVVKNAIYMAVKQNGAWQTPRILFGNGRDYSVQHPALSPDGTILYFASDMPGGYGGMDIYAAKKNADGTWGAPKNCGANINTTGDEAFPYVRKDGKFYFASEGNLGMGGLDLFSADGAYTTFSVAENLKAPYNSPKDDFGIWFTNDDSGYLSSNREGGKGLDDIYRFRVVKPAPQKPVLAVNGLVVDKETLMPLEDIHIVLVNQATGKEVSKVSDALGHFNFELEADMDYMVTGDKEKYYARQIGRISTKGVKQSTIYDVKFELERVKNTFIVRLNNIYYDFNKWDIRKDAVPELNRVVDFMNQVPDVNVQIRSHTDSRGPATYNLWLSQKRAASAVNYLNHAGIAQQRLTSVGLGETELINRCKDGVACSKEEHQLNRRTEFKVVKVEPVLSMDKVAPGSKAGRRSF